MPSARPLPPHHPRPPPAGAQRQLRRPSQPRQRPRPPLAGAPGRRPTQRAPACTAPAARHSSAARPPSHTWWGKDASPDSTTQAGSGRISHAERRPPPDPRCPRAAAPPVLPPPRCTPGGGAAAHRRAPPPPRRRARRARRRGGGTPRAPRRCPTPHTRPRRRAAPARGVAPAHARGRRAVSTPSRQAWVGSQRALPTCQHGVCELRLAKCCPPPRGQNWEPLLLVCRCRCRCPPVSCRSRAERAAVSWRR